MMRLGFYIILMVVCLVGDFGMNSELFNLISEADTERSQQISDLNYIKMMQLSSITDNTDFNSTDFNGRTVQIAVIHYPPFLNLKPGRNGFRLGGVLGSGQSWDLLQSMSAFFNFKPIIRESKDTFSIGYRNSSGGWTGLLGLLNRSEAEVALLPVTMTKARWEAVDFTIPMSTSAYGILAKRPHSSSKPDALLKPFNYEVWAWIMGTMVFMGPLIYVITKIRLRLCKGDLSLTKFFSLDQCVWFVFGAMMKQGSTLEPISDSSRILFATWWMAILIVTAFYTANLTAFLTFNGLDLPIKNVNDLKSLPDMKWLAPMDSGVIDFIQNQPQMEVIRQMRDAGKGSFTNDRISALNKVRDGSHIYVDDMRVLEYIIYSDFIEGRRIEHVDRCDFYATPIKETDRLSGESEQSFWWGFAFKKNSSVRDDFSVYFNRLNSYGILEFLHQNVSGSSVCELPKGFKDRALKNSDLLTTYYFTLVGIIISAFVFVVECFSWRSSLKKQKRLWNPSIVTVDPIFSKGIETPLPYKGIYLPPYIPHLPRLPKSKPRTPFAVKYPEFAENDFLHFYPDYAAKKGAKKPAKNNARTLTDLHRTEMSLLVYPFSQDEIRAEESLGDILEGSVNGIHVLWNQKDNKLIVKDPQKLRRNVFLEDGIPCLNVKFQNYEKIYKFVVHDK